MTEVERLIDRLTNDPTRKLAGVDVFRGPGPATPEEIAGAINSALDQVASGAVERLDHFPDDGLPQRDVRDIIREIGERQVPPPGTTTSASHR